MTNEFVFQARARLDNGQTAIITTNAYDRDDAKYQFAHFYWGRLADGTDVKLGRVDLRTVKLWEGEGH